MWIVIAPFLMKAGDTLALDAIYFDLDGTLVNLYGVKDWEDKLHSDNPTPYKFAAPLVDMAELNDLLELAVQMGVTIGVITWLAMDSNKDYDKLVRKAKKEWLEHYVPTVSECHMVKYGTPKHYVCNVKENAVLVDDNADVREKWTRGATIDATDSEQLLKQLRDLIVENL